MPLSVHIVVSLDHLSDQFVSAIQKTWQERREAKSRDLLFLPYLSEAWKAKDMVPAAENLGNLGNTILKELANRPVQSIELCAVFTAWDAQSTQTFLQLYQYFDSFLRMVTTRRIYAIYPQQPDDLGKFRKNFTELLTSASEKNYQFHEIQLMISPEDNDVSTSPWPPYQVEAYGALNFSAESRAVLDEVLNSCEHRFCNSSYGRFVFYPDMWQRYFILRAKRDLIESLPVTGDTTLDCTAEGFIQDNGLITTPYAFRFPVVMLGRVTIEEDLDFVQDTRPVQQLYERSQAQYIPQKDRLLKTERQRLEKTEESYRALLATALDKKRPLDGLKKALYIHQAMVNILEDSKAQRPLLREYVIHSDGIELVNSVMNSISLMTGGHLERIDISASDSRDSRMSLMFRRARGMMQDYHWSPATQGIPDVLCDMLGYLEKRLQATEVAELIDEKITERVVRSLTELDQGLKQLQEIFLGKKGDMEALKEKYRGIHRFTRRGAYQQERNAILKAIAEINQQYREWGRLTNILLEVTERFLFFHDRVQWIKQLLEETHDRIKETGLFLIKLDDAVTRSYDATKQALDGIPDGPVWDGVEFSFLSKADMEALYQKFGPVKVIDYAHSLIPYENALKMTGEEQAFRLLNEYPIQLESYCMAKFNTLPKLDLPSLLFHHFRELVVPRINELIHGIAQTLLPLREAHQKERKYQLILKIPSGVATQLQGLEQDFAYTNQRVSLHDPIITYVSATNQMQLELIMSLCGFRIDDYLYWEVFGNQGEKT